MKKYLMIMMAGLFLALPVKAADLQKGLDAYESDDYQTARAEFMPLAEAGNADAQFHLGFMYEKGLGVLQDYAEALKWYHLASEQRHAEAQTHLGMMYDKGRGVDQDYFLASAWYRLAAVQGHINAQALLGGTYISGEGIPQDLTVAHVWFNIAAANGNTQAADLRDRVAELITPANVRKAQDLAKKCLSSNYADCP